MSADHAVVRAEYDSRRRARAAHVAVHDRRHQHLGNARVAVAIGLAAGAWFGGWSAWPWLTTGLLAFGILAIVHTRVLNQRDRATRSVEFYEAGLRRLDDQWVGHGDQRSGVQESRGPGVQESRGPGVQESRGPGVQESSHAYAGDLDLFGRGSAFELLGTCRTEIGQVTVALWLLSPAPPAEARRRQDAVRELAPQLDLREALYVEGAAIADRTRPADLCAWATAPSALPAGAVWPWCLVLFPLAVVATLVWRLNGGPAGAFELALLVQTTVAIAFSRRVVAIIGRVDGPSRDLERLVSAATLIEARSFTAPALTQLQRRLTADATRATTASASIRRLARLDSLIASRRNVMFAPFAAVLLWGTQLAFRVEAWRRQDGCHVPDWLQAIGEFEALAALAGFAAEHPAFTFPDLQDDGRPNFRATALAHPLLPASAVSNDVQLGAPAPGLWLVSGSNMSGKSTFLRAIGLTTVLAQMGAPVRARQCTLSPLAVGASIRVTDSLQDGQSRFFAEILRLRQIVGLAKASEGRVLFLLDEMLSGTNSHDRRQGAEGILRGLTSLGAVGLATTHDLALGAIADALGPSATQVHFSDVFEDGALRFDYTLRPGPVRTSNALALMRSVGLEVGGP